MFNIAIVEDDCSATDLLQSYLEKYGKDNDVQFNIFKFGKALTFLTNYTGNYDVVFMDIELPDLNGMEAAKRLREVDKNVALVFVTNLAQFAVEGYEVNAFDFIVKPVNYAVFSLKLKRVLDRAKVNRGVKLLISVDDATMPISSDDIKYLEIISHNIIFHTVHGDYRSYGTLKKIEKQLEGANFMRCNSCYLVNFRYVTAVKGFNVFIGDDCLQISHPRKQAFLRALNDYFGEGGV